MSKATRVVVDGVNYPLDDTTAVDFSEAQSLSAAEKQQACTNIGLGNVDDTSDANKPISIAQQTALNAKLDTANVYNGLDKTATGYALDARQGKVLNDKINATQSDIAIIIDGNQTTHTGGVAVDEYVIVRNSTISGIADGLYKAVQAIPANAAITSAYLAAVDGGGLNVIQQSTAIKTMTLSVTTNASGTAVIPNTTINPNTTILVGIMTDDESYNATYTIINYEGTLAYKIKMWDTSGTTMQIDANRTSNITVYYRNY